MGKIFFHGENSKRLVSYSTFAEWLCRHRMRLLSAGFILLCLYPLLSCWYYGDDAVTRDLHAYIRFESENVLVNQFKYALQVGRLYPVHILQRFFVFYLLNNITAYRIFILIMNVLAVFSFAKLVKAYSGSEKLYYTILVLYAGVFLFLTRYDDAVTSYYMFIQMLVIYLSYSLILLKRYTAEKRTRYLFFSVFLYLLSLLTYESSYLLLPVYPLAVYSLFKGSVKEKIKKAWRLSLPCLMTALLSFAAYIHISGRAVSGYQGIRFSFDIQKITLTFLKQIVASFPVVPHAYLIFSPDREFIFDFSAALRNITLLDVFTACFFAFLIILIQKRYNDSYKNKFFLLWLAFLLIICPSLVIGFSAKYQDSLIWGLGYLPVYITRFGLLLLFFLLYEKLLSIVRFKRVKFVIQILLFGLLITTNLFSLQGNRNVVQHKNRSTYQRQIVEHAAEAGLFNNIPENAIILLGNLWYDYSSYNRNSIFSAFCDTRVRTDTLNSFIKSTFETYQQPKTYLYQDLDVYYFNYQYVDQNKGYAYICKIDTLTLNETDATTMVARNLKLCSLGNIYNTLNVKVLDENESIRKEIPIPANTTRYIEVPGPIDMLSLELRNTRRRFSCGCF